MAVDTHDEKDELDVVAEAEPGADGDPARRRKRRAMRVPSDDVPRPTPSSSAVVSQPVHVDSDIEFDVDVEPPVDEEPPGGNGRSEPAEFDVDLDGTAGDTDPKAAADIDEDTHPSVNSDVGADLLAADTPPDPIPPVSAGDTAPVTDTDAAAVTATVTDAASAPHAVEAVAVADEISAVGLLEVMAPVAPAPDAEPEPAPTPAIPVATPDAPTLPISAVESSAEPLSPEELELSTLELEEEHAEPARRSPPSPPPPAPPAAPPPAPSAAPPPAPAAAKPPALPPPRLAVAAAAALEPRPKKRRTRAWFEEIFDEDYLRTLPFLTPQTTQREAAFIIEGLAIKPGHHVLDVGCGYGRHAMELAARGFHVLALDLSLPLLLRGADEAQRRGLSINFVHGDMRELGYDAQFDGAYCVFSTFGFFDDDTNKRVVQGIARALKPGGRLVLDILNRDYIISDLPTRVWWEGDGCVVLEEVDFNYFNSRILSQRQIVFEDGRQLEQEISIRLYSLHEVGKLLHGAGFRVLQVSGGMAARGRFFGKDSRQIIVVAEKRSDTTRELSPIPEPL
jgi:SAM-dependent methyltransferase